jgi:hypothetical protein
MAHLPDEHQIIDLLRAYRPYLPLQPGTLLGQSQTPVTELKTRPDGQA